MEKKISEKLALWQQRLQQSDNEWKSEVADMDQREKRYNGGRTLSPLVEGDTKRNGQPKKTSHVRNIIFENIESQVSSTIPQPKVTPRRKKDERLANIIEHFLRNELAWMRRGAQARSTKQPRLMLSQPRLTEPERAS